MGYQQKVPVKRPCSLITVLALVLVVLDLGESAGRLPLMPGKHNYNPLKKLTGRRGLTHISVNTYFGPDICFDLTNN